MTRPAGHPRSGRPFLASPMLVGLALFVTAFLVRSVFLSRSYDIFVDEVTYFRLGNNLTDGAGLSLFGVPFFLHPPAFFFVASAFIDVLRPAGDIVHQVLATRILNVILASISAVAIFGIVSRAAGRRPGLAAAAIFVVEPFVVKVNSRLLLETMVMTWVLLGLYVLLVAGTADEPTSRSSAAEGGRPRLSRPALDRLAGALFGLALLTKDMAIFLTLLPIAVCVVTGTLIPRRRAVTIGAVTAATYALYPIGVLLAGLGPEFIAQKFRGLLRFAGVIRETGFDIAGAEGPSFLSAVFANFDVFALTYLLIAIGVPVVALLVRSGTSLQRLIGLWAGCAYALLGYTLVLGTLEEHFFYLLVVPVLVATATAWPLAVALTQRMEGQFPSAPPAAGRLIDAFLRLFPSLGTITLMVALAWGSVIWVQTRSTRDDSYSRMLDYMAVNVPDGVVLGVTHPLETFIFRGVVLEQVSSVADIAADHVRYVVISSKQVADGYTEGGQEISRWLESNATLQATFTGRSYGDLQLWIVRS